MMKRSILIPALLCAAGSFLVGATPSNPQPKKDKPANTVKLNGHTFTLPDGFTIELAAGPPLVDRPIAADFDEFGRLYVSESSGSNEPVKIQLEKKPHRILRLEDSDGDGRFDKRTVFADRMMFPEGVMYVRGSVYVAAPPQIWKLTDADGDGVAEKRQVWFDGKTLTGCANDLHGPYLGPDGWIYWCKGAFAEQRYERPGKKPFVTRASHIFRARPDGSRLEHVMTGGMDNPVDVVFTPTGERIFTTTFFQFPGGGKRDGLIHAVYGGVYGKDYHVIYDHVWTGPSLMPVLTHLGPAAPCGLHRYESSAFGKGYENNLFACLFNMQKVTRHALTKTGATFTSHDEDFLVSDNKDFHPTDVIEDADGSLLVIDTGGWYKLCCPTSQLVKPDVLGGIYRIRRATAPQVDDPRGLKLAWAKMPVDDLARQLADARPAVVKRTLQELAARPPDKRLFAAIRSMSSHPRAEPRVNSVWALTWIDHPSARTAIHAMLYDDNDSVVEAALHSVSVWRDRSAAKHVAPIFRRRSSPHTRRAAAEALGRIGSAKEVPALLEALEHKPDHVLHHSLTYALIEIGDAEAAAQGLKSKNPDVRRAVLAALDQMEKGNLRAETVLAELSASDPKLKETAWWIASRRPQWGPALAGFLRKQLGDDKLRNAEREELTKLLARMAKSPSIQELLAEQLRTEKPAARQVVLRAMAQAQLREAPQAWIDGVTAVLLDERGDALREAVATARALRLPKKGAEKLQQALLQIGTSPDHAADVRLSALAAIPSGVRHVEPATFAFLLKHVANDQPVAQRTLAADVLARARLDRKQLAELADTLKAAGPMEADRLLEAFANSADEQVGLRVVAALQASAARAGLRVQKVKSSLAKFGPAVQKEAEQLYASLKADTARQKEHLEKLLATLKNGDVHRGHRVFNSPKAACASCHAIGYLGGKTGPDLTHIGRVRTERDLLESIVFPSASFVQSYEPVAVATKDGMVHNGLIQQETADEIVLATGVDQQVRIARGDIEEILPGRVSVMPSGLDQQLTPQELADLVAFLKACK